MVPLHKDRAQECVHYYKQNQEYFWYRKKTSQTITTIINTQLDFEIYKGINSQSFIKTTHSAI